MSIKYLTSSHTPELRRGKLVRDCRVKKKLSQADLADLINSKFSKVNAKMSQSRISHIECGRDIHASELYYFVECLNLTFEELKCFESSDP